MTPFVLASTSQRRASLLSQQGVKFMQIAPDVDEQRLEAETPESYVRRLAVAKCQAGISLSSAELIVGSDTAVVIGDKIFDKPGTTDRASEILDHLRGRSCRVLSGLAVASVAGRTASKTVSAVVSSTVEFRDFSSEEAIQYVATGEPLDKAGAFAIQGLGSRLVLGFHGCYTNIVGLPLCELSKMLGIVAPDRVWRIRCVDSEERSCPRLDLDSSEERWLWSSQ